MAPPPWAGAPSHEQYFVLLTGANSGVGLGIGQRIIDEFLASRSLTSHLILIPTTRSLTKSRDTARALRSHLEETAASSSQLRARAGPDYTPQSAVDRVHVLGIQLDLCDLSSVYEAAHQLVDGEIRDPTGLIPDGVRIPRLDVALLNAGIGGWSGLDWPGVARQLWAVGIVQSATFPSFKKALPAAVLDQRKLLGGSTSSLDLKKEPPELAEVFCANVFGHYVLAHELLPLLSRASPDEVPGRVIWTSTIDAGREHLRFDDFQAARFTAPYESSKRITDLLCLSMNLPSVAPVSNQFFASSPSSSPSTSDKSKAKPIKPRFYVSQPGVVCSPLFPLNWFLFCAYWYAMLLARWLGSPWHPVTGYLGACASVWLALADQETLDAVHAERSKWGSSCTRSGHAVPKRTEIEGWAWEGKVESREALEKDDAEDEEDKEIRRVMRKSSGRKWDAEDLTEEQLADFEEDGRRCWAELERLRTAWEVALGKKDSGKAA